MVDDALIDQWEAAFRKGFAKPMILKILKEENQSYPYKITKQISEKTKGMVTIATSNIYPLLKDLKDEGLIIDVEETNRKIIYQLTKEGELFLNKISNSVLQFLSIMTNNFQFSNGGTNNG